MQTITLKLELQKPTKEKMAMYRKMTAINTAFSNWLLGFGELQTATSKVFKRYSDEPFPSAIVNQTIRTVNSKKKKQKAKTFRCMWCSFNNQNFKVERENGLYKVSFPTLEKRVGVPVVYKDYQQRWLDNYCLARLNKVLQNFLKNEGGGLSQSPCPLKSNKSKPIKLH